MLLTVDVVKEVDGVLDDAVADIAVVASGVTRRGILRDHDALAEFGIQVDLVVTSLQQGPLDRWIPFPSGSQVPFIIVGLEVGAGIVILSLLRSLIT